MYLNLRITQMRLVTTFGFIGALSPCIVADETAIKSVLELKSNTVLRSGDLFHPDSSLQVQLDRNYLAKKLSSGEKAQKLLDDVTTANKLADFSVQGLQAVKELKSAVSAPGRMKVLAKISPIYNDIAIKLKSYPADYDSIRSQLDENLRSKEPDPAKLLTIFFQGAAALSARIKSTTKADIPMVQVRLAQFRSNDPSRQPDQPFGYIPADAKSKVDSFIEKLSPSNGNPTPNELLDGLLRDVKEQAKNSFSKLVLALDKIKNDGLISLQAVASKAGANKPKWEELKSKYNEIFAQSTVIQQDIATFGSADGGSQNASQYLAKGRAILSDVAILENQVTELVTIAANLVKETNGLDLTSEYKYLKGLTLEITAEIAEAAKTTFSETLGSALYALNLNEDLELIGQTLKAANGEGTVTFDNNDGALGDLPKMQSYDKLQITVVVPDSDDPNKATKIGEGMNLYVWLNNRWDTITAVGYYHQSKNKWALTPIAGQLRKSFSGRNMDAARFGPSFGYSVLTVDSDNNGQVEVAVGLLGSLFDDHLLGGYAYNTGGKGSFWYLGYRFRLGK